MYLNDYILFPFLKVCVYFVWYYIITNIVICLVAHKQFIWTSRGNLWLDQSTLSKFANSITIFCYIFHRYFSQQHFLFPFFLWFLLFFSVFVLSAFSRHLKTSCACSISCVSSASSVSRLLAKLRYVILMGSFLKFFCLSNWNPSSNSLFVCLVQDVV